MIDNIEERTRELFEKDGWRCAESVLLAVTEELRVESNLIPAVATAFCSGLSRTSNLCGAYSGAVLAISILQGRSKPEESIDACYESVQSLTAQFENRFGSLTCPGVLGLDITNPIDLEEYRRRGLSERCYQCCSESARLVVELVGRINP